MIFDKLREKFLAGKEGDCSLVFYCDGAEVHRWKAYRVLVDQIDFIRGRNNFSEAADNDEIRIDITGFFDSSKINVEDFVVAVLSSCVDAVVDFGKFDLPTRYAIVRCRDFMGLPCKDAFFGDGSDASYDKRCAMFYRFLEHPEQVTSAIVDVLCCTGHEVQNYIIEQDLGFLACRSTAPNSDDHCTETQWKRTWDIIEQLENRDEDSCRRICFHQIEEYMRCFPKTSLGFGPNSYPVDVGCGKSVYSTLRLFFKLIGPEGNENYPEDFFKNLRKGHDFHLRWNVDHVDGLLELMEEDGFDFSNPQIPDSPYVEEIQNLPHSDCPHELQAKLQVLSWTRSFYNEKVNEILCGSDSEELILWTAFRESILKQITFAEKLIKCHYMNDYIP